MWYSPPSYHRRFSVKCFGTVEQITVAVNELVLLFTVAEEALGQHSFACRNRFCPHHRNLQITGILSSRLRLSPETVITKDFYDGLSSKTLELIMEGPIVSLPTSFIADIALWVASDAREISNMQRVSRLFSTVCKSDRIWETIALKTIWLGRGRDGSEDDDWDFYRLHFGLPHFNCLRIRWISHNFSRLKLFYGSIHREGKRHDTPVIPLTRINCETFSSSILQTVGCLIPNSAVYFEESPRLLLRNSRIVSPPSDAVPQFLRAAIVTECVQEYASALSPRLREAGVPAPFSVSHIGDDRITFAQFNHQEQGSSVYERAGIYTRLIDKSLGLIVAIENCDKKDQYEVIQEVSDIFTRIITRSPQLMPEDISVSKSDDNRLDGLLQAHTPFPVLVLLAFSTANQNNAEDFSTPPKYQAGEMSTDKSASFKASPVSSLVVAVSTLLGRLMERGCGRDRQRSWYVQPCLWRAAIHTPLRHQQHQYSASSPFFPSIRRPAGTATTSLLRPQDGFYAGLNWLIRAIGADISKRSSQY